MAQTWIEPSFTSAKVAFNEGIAKGADLSEILYRFPCPGCGRSVVVHAEGMALAEEIEGRCEHCLATPHTWIVMNDSQVLRRSVDAWCEACGAFRRVALLPDGRESIVYRAPGVPGFTEEEPACRK